MRNRASVVRRANATESPPEIQFPANVESRAVLPEAAGARVPLGRARRPALIQGVGAHDLGLGIKAAAGDAKLRAGFHDLQPGDFHARIVRIGLRDDIFQDGVVEKPPPFSGIWLRPRLGGQLQRRRVPLAGPCLARRFEVRAKLHAPLQAEHASQQQTTVTSQQRHWAKARSKAEPQQFKLPRVLRRVPPERPYTPRLCVPALACRRRLRLAVNIDGAFSPWRVAFVGQCKHARK
ncbi:hypothetical protein G6F65_017275 [Rhizopus arrhizus]|nr:hypothetical protein G6F65_017275 [Rhizopus arrhizus]